MTRSKPRNAELAIVLKNDPARLRERVVLAKRGKGRKNRPANNRAKKETGEWQNQRGPAKREFETT
jgi:hypothetical protein